MRAVLLVLAILSAIALRPTTTAAAVVPVGPEFRVNETDTRSGWLVDIATSPERGFVVVFGDRERHGARETYIRGRRFGPRGEPLGSSFRIDSRRPADLRGSCCPAVATDASGAFAVAWSWDDHQVLFRRFDADGGRLGGERDVNPEVKESAVFADAAMWPDGRFVVVWDGGGRLSKARVFDATGHQLTDVISIDSDHGGANFSPRVARRADGGFVSAWFNFEYGVAARNIGRIYQSDGKPRGSAFVIDSTISGYLSSPSIAGAADDGFVVSWTRRESADDPGGIYARRFDARGRPNGPVLTVGTRTEGIVGLTDVGLLPDGGFVVVWGEHNVLNPEIRGREFGPDGSARSEVFQVSATGGSDYPAVATDADGDFVVVWSVLAGTMAQRFTTSPICGDSDGDDESTATDALVALHAAIGLADCALCLCDTSGNRSTSATDALLILRHGTGEGVSFACPACS